jgi:hypothetical protein
MYKHSLRIEVKRESAVTEDAVNHCDIITGANTSGYMWMDKSVLNVFFTEENQVANTYFVFEPLLPNARQL